MKKRISYLNARTANLAENRWISRLRFQLWMCCCQPTAKTTHSRCFSSKFRLQLIRESAHHTSFCDLNVRKCQEIKFWTKLIKVNNNKNEWILKLLLGQLIFPLAGILKTTQESIAAALLLSQHFDKQAVSIGCDAHQRFIESSKHRVNTERLWCTGPGEVFLFFHKVLQFVQTSQEK